MVDDGFIVFLLLLAFRCSIFGRGGGSWHARCCQLLETRLSNTCLFAWRSCSAKIKIRRCRFLISYRSSSRMLFVSTIRSSITRWSKNKCSHSSYISKISPDGCIEERTKTLVFLIIKAARNLLKTTGTELIAERSRSGSSA